jgi:hypothetical protein
MNLRINVDTTIFDVMNGYVMHHLRQLLLNRLLVSI